jgi:hypothetical protein
VKPSRIALPILLTAIAGCLAMLTIATPVHAQNQALLGKWNMTSTAPDNDVLWTLTIEYKDGKYEATSSTGEGAGPVKGLRVEGNEVHFSVDYRGGEYAIDLTLQGDSLTGTWSGQGDSGATKGQRST